MARLALTHIGFDLRFAEMVHAVVGENIVFSSTMSSVTRYARLADIDRKRMSRSSIVIACRPEDALLRAQIAWKLRPRALWIQVSVPLAPSALILASSLFPRRPTVLKGFSPSQNALGLSMCTLISSSEYYSLLTFLFPATLFHQGSNRLGADPSGRRAKASDS